MKHIDKNYQGQRAKRQSFTSGSFDRCINGRVGRVLKLLRPTPRRESANLIKLDLGMTKAQATQTMGDKTATGRYGTFSNPYKREIIKGPTGETYDVLYYYTGETSVRRMRTLWSRE